MTTWSAEYIYNSKLCTCCKNTQVIVIYCVKKTLSSWHAQCTHRLQQQPEESVRLPRCQRLTCSSNTSGTLPATKVQIAYKGKLQPNSKAMQKRCTVAPHPQRKRQRSQHASWNWWCTQQLATCWSFGNWLAQDSTGSFSLFLHLVF